MLPGLVVASPPYHLQMCRSIKTLRSLDPPVTTEEVHAAALQFVRKVSGYRQPSTANEEAFEAAVHDIAARTQMLLDELVVRGEPRSREAMWGHGRRV